MKILNVEQTKALDSYTIIHEPIASIDLMERAAWAIYNLLEARLSVGQKISIFCGTGNNGGDGLVLARMLMNHGFEVYVYHLQVTENTTEEFRINLKILSKLAVNQLYEISNKRDIPCIQSTDIVIDAIFGSGLNKSLHGIPKEIVQAINASGAIVISIDIPSGLMSNQAIDILNDTVIHADYTFTFQFPKLSFLFPENENIVGCWEVLPIGLHEGYIASLAVDDNFMMPADVKTIVRKRSNFSHKGSFGHALLIAGSEGKSGAAILSAKACLRAGAGLLHVHVPRSTALPLQLSLPESMLSIDSSATHISQLPELESFNAIGIGPGIGKDDETSNAFKLLIQEVKFPMVIDADALNLLSENKTWLAYLAAGSILTPHPKEFERLVGQWSNSFEGLELQKAMSVKYQLIIVVKGAYSTITDSQGHCWMNSTGNPGMATAGSGDVLTGMILGLLAQGYLPIEAAKLGVFLHGLAGDIAAEERGFESLMASDIIENIGRAYKKLNPPT